MELLAAGEDHKALRLVARELIAKAQAGDMQAIKELAERTDGKVPQAIVGDDEGDPINLVTEIRRTIVRPQERSELERPEPRNG